MEKAIRARKAETPKQPSLRLRLRAPYLYPDPGDRSNRKQRSSYGGDEIAEAFGKRVTIYGDSASVQAVMRVNAEQASKRTMHRPTR
jgi:hypothetical protein